MSKKDGNRFQIVSEEKVSMASGNRIIRDKETGVLYFYHCWGYGGGITPLLDRDGKPLVDAKKE